MAQVLYGVDYYHTRSVDVIASIAPRPIFLIHGADDNTDHATTPPSDMYTLAAAALSGPHANVQTWLVPGATGNACPGLPCGGESLRRSSRRFLYRST